ncbi:MAG: hypothetical protein ACE5K4_08230 [Candidatus Hydrothermarchaeota archaeon]
MNMKFGHQFYEEIDLEDEEDIVDILTLEDAEEIIERLVRKRILIYMGKEYVLSKCALDKILDFANRNDYVEEDLFERILRGIKCLLDESFTGASSLDESEIIRYVVIIFDLGKFTEMFPTIRESFESICPNISQDSFEDYSDT